LKVVDAQRLAVASVRTLKVLTCNLPPFSPFFKPFLLFVNEVNVMSTALVVEDSLTDMQILTSCLRQGGLNVVTANSGEEALAKISSDKPDIIILDVVLPGCSGFEVCRELKYAAGTSNIPIVICSTKGGEMDKFWGMRQGADAYLAKPIDQEEFVRTVKQLIKA
jgi:DNA-binding response OmpR family regulator